MLSQIYMHDYVDYSFICGDFNGRIGSLLDYVKEIDSVPDRTIHDKEVNGHGRSLIDFLLDARFCVTNGRITPACNNFTSISRKGKAIVD